MAYNDISKNFTYENGGTIDGDLALTTMAANTKIKNKASGQLYSKRSGFTNVFDKTNTYANYLKADEFGIITSGSGNGVASITYSTSGRKITQNLTTFTTPSDLATVNDNLKSQAVGSITVSGRTVTYKNVNGQPLGTFQTQDNDTTYSAGTGLYLNGTQFNVRIPNANNEYGNNNNYLMVMNSAQNKCVPLSFTLNQIFDYINVKVAATAVRYGSERIVYTDDSRIGSGQMVSGSTLYGDPGNDSTYMSAQLGGTWKITSGLSYHHTYSHKVHVGEGSGAHTDTVTYTIYQCYAKQFLG